MPIRLDYQLIGEYVQPGSRVLDLGCGDGLLLENLVRNKGVDGYGIDVDMECVKACISRGVPVYHGDMLEGMEMLSDGSFDCVVLSRTLQQTLQPARVVQEMLRIGTRAIISFPNFGHWKVRVQVLLRGRIPRTEQMPEPWHLTPDVHPLSVRDFLSFCKAQRLRSVDRIYLALGGLRVPAVAANLLADVAIFVLEYEEAAARPENIESATR